MTPHASALTAHRGWGTAARFDDRPGTAGEDCKKAPPAMSFHRNRAFGINFRTDNARNPVLFHRSSTAVGLYETGQSPVDDAHQQRIRTRLRRQVIEAGQARRNEGRYLPSHRRTRGYQKRR